MALLICPECGRQVSDMAEACPNCGYPVTLMKGEESNVEPENVEELVVEEIAPAEITDLVQYDVQSDLSEAAENEKKKVSKLFLIGIPIIILGLCVSNFIGVPLCILGIIWIIYCFKIKNKKAVTFSNLKQDISKSKKFVALGLVVLLVISGAFYYHQKTIDAQLAERNSVREYNYYVDCAVDLYRNALNGGVACEKVSTLVTSVWHDKLLDRVESDTKQYTVGAKDFDEAIGNVYDDSKVQDKISTVNDCEDDMKMDVKRLKEAPDDFSQFYQDAVDLVSTYGSFASIINEPGGYTYDSYSDTTDSKDSELATAVKKIVLEIPEKMDVPAYTSDQQSTQTDFDILDLVDQSYQNIPEDYTYDDSENTYSKKSTLFGVSGTITFCGDNPEYIDLMNFETDSKMTDDELSQVESELESFNATKSEYSDDDYIFYNWGYITISITSDDDSTIIKAYAVSI